MARKDSKGYQLRTGESQRKDGKYCYAYTDRLGKRHYIYSKTLVELREKERQLQRDYEDGLDPAKAKTITVNDMVQRYLDNKNNLKSTTKGVYVYLFDHIIKKDFGKRKIINVKYTDILTYYYGLIKNDGYSGSTVDHVNTVLYPAFKMAIRDGLIRTNPAEGVMAEIKASKYFVQEKREALSIDEQRNFMEFLRGKREYAGWVPIITVLLGTGCRIGEVLGLTWNDLNFDERTISITHAFTDSPDENRKTRKRIHSTKTKAGVRIIPMFDEVYQAFLDEYEFQKCIGFCEEEIDGYSGFVFSTASHTVYLPAAINHAIHRAIAHYNSEEKAKAAYEDRKPIFLPDFSCHHLRHTFCTRLCENDVNPKVIQVIMGHSDITTTMNIYAEVKKEKKLETFEELQGKIIF